MIKPVASLQTMLKHTHTHTNAHSSKQRARFSWFCTTARGLGWPNRRMHEESFVIASSSDLLVAANACYMYCNVSRPPPPPPPSFDNRPYPIAPHVFDVRIYIHSTERPKHFEHVEKGALAMVKIRCVPPCVRGFCVKGVFA